MPPLVTNSSFAEPEFVPFAPVRWEDVHVDGLAPLVALRESQGLQTAVVDVEDVYDEFAGGRFTPAAIRDFVEGLD